MAVYSGTFASVNLSAFGQSILEKNEAIRSHERGSTTPTAILAGQLWDCTDAGGIIAGFISGSLVVSGVDEVIVWRQASPAAWKMLLDPKHAALNAGGTVLPQADLPMNARKFTGLAEGSGNGHSVRFEQACCFTGSGQMTARTKRIEDVATPTASGHAATKGYVDSADSTNAANITSSTPKSVAFLDLTNTGSTKDTDPIDFGFEPVWVDVHFTVASLAGAASPLFRFGRPAGTLPRTESKTFDGETYSCTWNSGGTITIKVPTGSTYTKANAMGWQTVRNV